MKSLLALALTVALGNTAAAGPFGVSMGDAIKPDDGWNARGYGRETREYEGDREFDTITLEGTRKHGVCSVTLRGGKRGEGDFHLLIFELERKYGKGSSAFSSDPPLYDGGISFPTILGSASWNLSRNPDNIKEIAVTMTTSTLWLSYKFENDYECSDTDL